MTPPERLKAIAAKIRQDATSSHFGDSHYACVISSDKVDAITAAIPALLAQVADLELRLSVATDLNVGDRQRITALEARIAEIAALLDADPLQDLDADLATIEAATMHRHELEATVKRMAQGQAEDAVRASGLERHLAAARAAAQEVTQACALLVERVGTLEVENARLRRDVRS